MDARLRHVPLPLRLIEELLVSVDEVDTARLGHLVRGRGRGRGRG